MNRAARGCVVRGAACALAAVAGAACAGVGTDGAGADPAAEVLPMLPDDAAVYAIFRPDGALAALEDVRRRVGPVWALPPPPAGFAGLDTHAGWVAAGLHPAGPAALAALRPEAGGATLLARVADADAAAATAGRLAARPGVRAAVRDGWLVVEAGAAPGRRGPAPARLPAWPTPGVPATARLDLSLLAEADAHLGGGEDCLAAWASSSPFAERVDAGLARDDQGAALLVEIALTEYGRRVTAAGLRPVPPPPAAVAGGQAVSAWFGFDAGAASRAADPPVTVTAPNCPLFGALGPVALFPQGDLGSATERQGPLRGARALGLTVGPGARVGLSIDYGRPVAAVQGDLAARGLALTAGGTEELHLPLPFLGMPIGVRLDGAGATARLAVGYGGPPPGPVAAAEVAPDGAHGEDARGGRLIAEVAVRMAGLADLRAALPVLHMVPWLAYLLDSDIDRAGLSLTMLPGRLRGEANVRWKTGGGAK